MATKENNNEFALVEYKYIKFEEFITRTKKTKEWLCSNIKSDVVLGRVQWYAGWRQYCFISIDNSIVLSSGCLNDISDFLVKIKDVRK